MLLSRKFNFKNIRKCIMDRKIEELEKRLKKGIGIGWKLIFRIVPRPNLPMAFARSVSMICTLKFGVETDWVRDPSGFHHSRR